MTGKMYINITKIDENDNPNGFIFFFFVKKYNFLFFFLLILGGKLSSHMFSNLIQLVLGFNLFCNEKVTWGGKQLERDIFVKGLDHFVVYPLSCDIRKPDPRCHTDLLIRETDYCHYHNTVCVWIIRPQEQTFPLKLLEEFPPQNCKHQHDEISPSELHKRAICG